MLRKMLGLEKKRIIHAQEPDLAQLPVEPPVPQLFAPFVPGEAEWIETAEVLVVGKRERVVEEISTRVNVSEREQEVTASLRFTETEVERSGPPGARGSQIQS